MIEYGYDAAGRLISMERMPDAVTPGPARGECGYVASPVSVTCHVDPRCGMRCYDRIENRFLEIYQYLTNGDGGKELTMKLLRSSLLTSALLLLLAGGLPPVSLGQDASPEATSLATVVAERRAQLRDLRNALDQDPADSALWEQLIREEGTYRTLRALLSGELDQMQPEVREAWHWGIVEQLIGEWMARRPDDPAPHLALARHYPTAEGRLAILQEAASRFSGSASVHGALARQLRDRGENARATELLEGFVEHHPEDPEGFHQLWGHYRHQGNVSRANAVLETWLDHHPSDLKALKTWFRSAVSDQNQVEARDIAHRIVSHVDASQAAISVCEDLEAPFDGAFLHLAAQCFDQVAATADEETLRFRAIAGHGRAMAALGAAGDLLAALDKLPEDRRPRALLYAGMAMAQRQQCDDATDLFERLAEHRDDSLSFPTHIARFLTNACEHTDGARQLVLQLLETAEPREVLQIASSWRDHLPHDRLEAVLQHRLDLDPGADALWEALDELYEAAGHERRRSHLQAWVRLHPSGGADRWLDLAHLHLAEGDPSRAITTLEEALSRHRGHPSVVETLAGLLLMAGESSRAETLVEELLARDSKWATEQALLLRARLLAAREDRDGALRAYEEYFRAHSGAAPEPVREYAFLLATGGAVDETIGFLDEQFRTLTETAGMAGTSRHGYLATELDAIGLHEEALGFLLQAAEGAPEDADLLRRIGRLALELGRWDQAEAAFRRLVGLDPGNQAHWSRLAEVYIAQDDVAALRRVASEAREATGQLPSRIGYILGRDALERGDLVEAIKLLRTAQESNPYDREISSALEEAYRRLGRNHG